MRYYSFFFLTAVVLGSLESDNEHSLEKPQILFIQGLLTGYGMKQNTTLYNHCMVNQTGLLSQIKKELRKLEKVKIKNIKKSMKNFLKFSKKVLLEIADCSGNPQNFTNFTNILESLDIQELLTHSQQVKGWKPIVSIKKLGKKSKTEKKKLTKAQKKAGVYFKIFLEKSPFQKGYVIGQQARKQGKPTWRRHHKHAGRRGKRGFFRIHSHHKNLLTYEDELGRRKHFHHKILEKMPKFRKMTASKQSGYL